MRKTSREYPYEKEIAALAKLTDSEVIRPELYPQNNVMRGLRDADGKGVLCGLTEVSEVNAFRNENGTLVPMEGELYYRGVNVKELVAGCVKDKRFGFEECTYLLLFGKLPTARELEDFRAMLADLRRLPRNFVRDVVMKSPSHDIMNMLARCVLNLYSYDKNPDDITVENVLDKGCIIVLDGQEEIYMEGGSKVEFMMSERRARFVRFDTDFYSRVKDKLVNSL